MADGDIKRRPARRRRIFLILLLLGIGFYVYAKKIETRWIQVTRYEVQLAGLPDSLDGLKVVQLSDVHRSDRTPDSIIEKAVRLANSESPDIIVLTGDFINEGPENPEICAKILSRLKAPKGIYAVLGNHDHWNGQLKITRALESKGIHLLTNKNMQVAPGLYIIGIDDYWSGHPNVSRAWSGVDESKG